MKPKLNSRSLLGVTRSKAKMIEYQVPPEYHITPITEPSKLFCLTIGILGDLAALRHHGKGDSDLWAEMRSNLVFSAYFFDAFLESKINEDISSYLLLLASAAYYLCALPGASNVLATRLGPTCPDLDGGGIENLLHWLLQGDSSGSLPEVEGRFGSYSQGLAQTIFEFFRTGSGKQEAELLATKLRELAYRIGSPRELLLADLVSAVLMEKLQNSCWTALPEYSGLGSTVWQSVIQRNSFPKELWPAQHLLGQAGVFQGVSAIVQMPTSAGKTKATELVIRSAFLAGRTSLAIIVAPFRALCHEIKNSLKLAFQNESVNVDELSDVTQEDFTISDLLSSKQVVVVTPEKLLYVLRHAPELAANVGLVIYDEGHQFDSGSRGIVYELLLTSLQSLLPSETQKILISAVISNARALGDWLNGENSAIVTGTSLSPTLKSVGFASWKDFLGRIEFVEAEDPDRREYYVPRVIESKKLPRKSKETTDRFFPDRKKVSQSLSI